MKLSNPFMESSTYVISCCRKLSGWIYVYSPVSSEIRQSPHVGDQALPCVPPSLQDSCIFISSRFDKITILGNQHLVCRLHRQWKCRQEIGVWDLVYKNVCPSLCSTTNSQRIESNREFLGTMTILLAAALAMLLGSGPVSAVVERYRACDHLHARKQVVEQCMLLKVTNGLII